MPIAGIIASPAPTRDMKRAVAHATRPGVSVCADILLGGPAGPFAGDTRRRRAMPDIAAAMARNPLGQSAWPYVSVGESE